MDPVSSDKGYNKVERPDIKDCILRIKDYFAETKATLYILYTKEDNAIYVETKDWTIAKDLTTDYFTTCIEECSGDRVQIPRLDQKKVTKSDCIDSVCNRIV